MYHIKPSDVVYKGPKGSKEKDRGFSEVYKLKNGNKALKETIIGNWETIPVSKSNRLVICASGLGYFEIAEKSYRMEPGYLLEIEAGIEAKVNGFVKFHIIEI